MLTSTLAQRRHHLAQCQLGTCHIGGQAFMAPQWGLPQAYLGDLFWGCNDFRVFHFS